MILIDIFAWSFFICLVYIILYRFTVIFKSSQGRLVDISNREYHQGFLRKFTVVIYSHNNSQKVKKLIESFQKQNYAEEGYSINVILDNCDAENTKLLEILGGTRLWRLNTDVKPLGKYKAYAWLLERLRAFENTNAFIFLDADCKIKNDFLEKANLSMKEHDVVAGETIKRKSFLLNRIINFRNKINNRVFRHGRFHAGLGNVIDTDVLIAKQEVMEKIEFKTINNSFEEYEYPIDLKRCNIPIHYSSDITVYKNQEETLASLAVKDYKRRYRALVAFMNNFDVFYTKSKLSVKETVLSLIYASGTVFIFWNLVLLFISYKYTNTSFAQIITPNILIGLLAAKIFSNFYSMVVMRASFLEYYYSTLFFFLAPIMYMRSILVGFISPLKNKKENDLFIPEATNFETNIAEVTITDGKKEIPCKIEITKTDDNAKVTFMFKDKKLSSGKHPRVWYAVDEIIEKLKKHGFSLKVCSNCGYFYITEATAAHTDGEKGYCLYKNFKEDSKDKEYTPVWNTCPNIIPAQARGYILQQIGIDKNMFKGK